jgi:hypothetical protein
MSSYITTYNQQLQEQIGRNLKNKIDAIQGTNLTQLQARIAANDR